MYPRDIAPGRDVLYSAEKQERRRPVEFFSFDEEYLCRLVRGDADTECHFVEYFSGLLRAKLQLRLRSVQDAEDLRQEVFLRVLRSLRSGPGIKQAGKLGAFVNAVCNNVIFEHIRTRSRTSQWDDRSPEPRENNSDLERDLLSEEARENVRVVLNELSAKDRGLLQAVFLEERDKDLVCSEYGVKRDYLRVLLHRARRRLRDLLSHPAPPLRAAMRTSGGKQ